MQLSSRCLNVFIPPYLHDFTYKYTKSNITNIVNSHKCKMTNYFTLQ